MKFMVMKRLCLLAICLLCCSHTFAAEPYKVYCSLIGEYAEFNESLINLQVDYGQEKHRKNYLVDSEGRALSFPTMISALNYMSKRGWSLDKTDVHYLVNITDKKEIDKRIVVWILVKEVCSDEEMTEGFQTRLMFEKGNN